MFIYLYIIHQRNSKKWMKIFKNQHSFSLLLVFFLLNYNIINKTKKKIKDTYFETRENNSNNTKNYNFVCFIIKYYLFNQRLIKQNLKQYSLILQF